MTDRYYHFIRRDIEPLLPSTATRVIDVGAGTGATSRWLRGRYPNAYFVGLEGKGSLADELRHNVDEAHVVDLNGPLPEVGAADLVLFLDVLEHLVHPQTVLRKLTANVPAEGTVIVSLPNIAHLSVSAPLLFRASFEYRDAGILDRTHLHFFTRQSAVEFIESAGFTAMRGLRSGFTGPRARLLDRLSFGAMRDHLTKQYIIGARRVSVSLQAAPHPVEWGLAPESDLNPGLSPEVNT